MPSDGLLPGLYVYIICGLFLTAFVVQLSLICYRNNFGLCRARISYDLNKIKVRVHLR